MLAILMTIFGGIFSGGATGLLGVLLQRFFDLKNKQQDVEIIKLNLANNLELARMESDRLKIKVEADLAEAEIEGRTQEHISDNDLVEASYETDKASYIDKAAMKANSWPAKFVLVLMGIVDFLRGFLRPGMTIYLCVVTTYMFFWAQDLMLQNNTLLTAASMHEIVLQIIGTILYVFTTAAVWYFGARSTHQPPKR